MPTEKDFETALAKYPELIEEGLQLIGRQMTMYGRRMALVFSDRFQRTLIAELKWGPIKDTHIGQIMAYEGILLSSTDPSIRVMLIGTRVPPNLRNSLDHHGIAWKEIKQTDLTSFLGSKCDHDLLRVFEGVAAPPLGVSQKRSSLRSSRTEATPKTKHDADNQAGQSGDFGKRKNPEQLAELKAALDAYRETAEPDMQFRDDKTENYCQVFPLEWLRSYLHYEFHQHRKRGLIGAELHIHSPNASIAEFLKPLHGRDVANGKGTLTWDETCRPGSGHLAALFKLDTPPGTVAAGMRDLISMTRSGVSARIAFGRDLPR